MFCFVNSDMQENKAARTTNCYFYHSIVSLHLCKEYSTVVKFKMTVVLLIKHWTFWCMDHSMLWWYLGRWRIGKWPSRSESVSHCFAELLQRIFNRNKIQDRQSLSPGVCVFAQPLASGWTAECQRTVFLASGRPNLWQPLSSILSAFRSRLSGWKEKWRRPYGTFRVSIFVVVKEACTF